ncbi:hypothetical protein Fmac_027000 [Flemingia macrophylla]|uniref:Uncharacterized protein n=1 Tax=Flemingia macrophylla TaxID=520843 RepID=A0ABD1LGL0_9FABA
MIELLHIVDWSLASANGLNANLLGISFCTLCWGLRGGEGREGKGRGGREWRREEGEKDRCCGGVAAVEEVVRLAAATTNNERTWQIADSAMQMMLDIKWYEVRILIRVNYTVDFSKTSPRVPQELAAEASLGLRLSFHHEISSAHVTPLDLPGTRKEEVMVT